MAKKEFKSESKRLMEMMINSIYTNKEIFLREIISNASDALDKLHFISLTDENAPDSSDYRIFINADKSARTLTISDNGIGMNLEDLEENLGTIAKSGSLKFKEELPQDQQADIIGQFGVGFYSAFMVADEVTVITKKFGEEQAYKWFSAGADGYSIDKYNKDSVGTDIIMHIKEDLEDEKYSIYLEDFKISELIKKYSDYINYPIKMDIKKQVNVANEDAEEPKYETVIETKTLNSMVPIWRKNKSEVTEEELNNYYKEKFMDFIDPLATIQVSAEGVVSYKALLYIPANLPHGYYTKENEKGLQLYSNGVLIMEKCEQLLPDYFRFVKGVVDSQDLSLNISRELLQNDRQLAIIAKNIEKKIKSELIKMQKNDFEKYSSFWKNFGLQIKYGVVSNYGMNKDMLKDLLIFRSSSVDGYTTLADYISRMREEQKFIYYACGETEQKISIMPQTELCNEKNYEILYFTDDVDEFVTQALIKFDEKEFKSITADDSQLETEEEKKETEKKSEENKELLEFLQKTLEGKVGNVIISQKLKNHPVCLSAEGGVTLEMEKYFASMPGDGPKPKATKVLEVNPTHPVFNKLKELSSKNEELAQSYTKILYNQALLLADFPIEDTKEYCDLVCSLLK